MNTYRILTPVEHDGKRFEPGYTIDLEDAQAAPLLALAAIEWPVAAVVPAEAGKSSKSA